MLTISFARIGPDCVFMALIDRDTSWTNTRNNVRRLLDQILVALVANHVRFLALAVDLTRLTEMKM
jgi:hypothetical protein